MSTLDMDDYLTQKNLAEMNLEPSAPISAATAENKSVKSILKESAKFQPSHQEPSPSSSQKADVSSVHVKKKAAVIPPSAPPEATVPMPPSPYRPTRITNVIRIEARWAPKDFKELRSSTAKMHLRLAPIMSCFNNEHTWLMEWQTDQLAADADLEPTQFSKFLSIRVVPMAKECFYFSFRIHSTGTQFMQVAKSKIMSTAKMGEH